MKKIILLFLATALVASCKQKNDEASSLIAADQAAITAVYKEVNAGLLNKDGVAIYKNLDKASIDYYANLLDSIKAKEVVGTMVDKMNIVTGLLLLNDEDLKTTDTKKLVELLFLNSAVDEEKKEVLLNAGLSNIKIDGDMATAYIFNVQEVKFSRENGEWKYNLLALQKTTEDMLKSVQKENEMTDKELLTSMISHSEFANNPNVKRDFIEVFALMNEEAKGDKE